MADRIKGITVEIGGNTTKLQTALKGVNASIRESQNALRDVNKLLKMDPGNTELLKQKQDILNKAITDTKDKLKQEKEALEQLKKSDAAGKNKEQIQALEREIVATTQSLKGLEEQAKQSASVLGSQMQLAGEKIKEVGDKIQGIGQKVVGVGETLTQNVTAPIMAVGGVASNFAMTFEDAMAKVSTIADTSQVPLEELEQQIKTLSKESGIDASEIAENVYNAISAGQETGDAVAFVGNATKLARAGFAETGQALDVLTTTMNAYGMSADEVSKVSDILINTQNQGKTTVGELASSMGKIIPTAKQYDVGLEQIAAGYAKMTSNGIATAESTTYMNGMLNELGKSGTKVADTLKEKTGKSFADLMKDGKTITDVLNIVKDAAEENGKQFADMWGSAEAGKAAATLVDTTNKLGDLNDVIASMKEAGGDSVDETAEAYDKLNTTSKEIGDTLNELKLTVTELGQTLNEMLAPALSQVSEAVSQLNEWFSSLDEEQKQSIVTAAAVIAAVGPLLTIIGNVIIFIGQITSAIGTITAAAGSAWTTITAAFEGIAAAAGVAVGTVMAAFALVAAAVVIWIKNWEDIKAMFTDGIPYAVGLLVDKIKDMVNKIGQFFKQLGVNISTAWRTAINNVTNAVGQWKANLIAKCKEIVESIKTTFSNLAKDAKEWGKDLIDGLIQGIKDGVGKVEQTAKDVAAAVAKYIHFSEPDVGPLSNFHTFMPDMIKEMTKGIESNVNMLDAPMAEVANKLVPNNAVELSYSPKLAGQMDSLTNAIGAIRPSDSMRVVLEGDMAQLFKAYKLEENSRVIRYGRA